MAGMRTTVTITGALHYNTLGTTTHKKKKKIILVLALAPPETFLVVYNVSEWPEMMARRRFVGFVVLKTRKLPLSSADQIHLVNVVYVRRQEKDKSLQVHKWIETAKQTIASRG